MDDTFDFYYDEIKLTENILYNFLVFIFQCYCQEKNAGSTLESLWNIMLP